MKTGTAIQIKERPILFSTPMVKAILEGRKTMTRRILKECKKHPDKLCKTNPFNSSHTALRIPETGSWVWHPTGNLTKEMTTDVIEQYCPYGQIGGRLWVRETFLDGDDYPCSPHHDDETVSRWAYKADCPAEQTSGIIWKPSIHMPRIASRIMLEITNIRVERLQDISGKDATAEGVGLIRWEWSDDEQPEIDIGVEREGEILRKKFERLWNKINGADSWAANPWVWVIEFKKL